MEIQVVTCTFPKAMLRDRPFKKKIRTTQELEYFFFFARNKTNNFFRQNKKEFNIRLYDKYSQSDYFFFLPPKSEYFFQQHWESEYFFRKKTITPPPPPPPLQVKWSFPYVSISLREILAL